MTTVSFFFTLPFGLKFIIRVTVNVIKPRHSVDVVLLFTSPQRNPFGSHASKTLRCYHYCQHLVTSSHSLHIRSVDGGTGYRHGAVTSVELLLGAFAKLQKENISCVMSVRSFVHPSTSNSAATGRIFMIFEYFSRICRENSSFMNVRQE